MENGEYRISNKYVTTRDQDGNESRTIENLGIEQIRGLLDNINNIIKSDGIFNAWTCYGAHLAINFTSRYHKDANGANYITATYYYEGSIHNVNDANGNRIVTFRSGVVRHGTCLNDRIVPGAQFFYYSYNNETNSVETETMSFNRDGNRPPRPIMPNVAPFGYYHREKRQFNRWFGIAFHNSTASRARSFPGERQVSSVADCFPVFYRMDEAES